MSLRNTVIALVLLALIGGYAYFVASKQNPEDNSKKLFTLKAEDIRKIDLKAPKSEIELDRSANNKWTLVKPIKSDADETAANNLARAIANCEVKKTVDEKPADLTPFGLAKPDMVVTVSTKAKTFPGIEVGKNTPVGFSAYIKTTDKPAVLLTNSAFPLGMKKKVDDLRDRELMTFKVDDAQKITLEETDNAEIELDKAHDKWRIVKPGSYLADQTQVRQMLSALANAKVDEFIDDAPADVLRYGLDKPRLTIAVYTGKEESRQSLLFGEKEKEQGKDGIYVRRGERTPVYTVHNWVFADANKDLLDLRDKTVLNFDPDKVKQVAVTNEGKSFSLERNAKRRWEVNSTGMTDADPAVADRFLEQVHDLKAQSIVEDPVSDPKKYGLDSPTETIELKGKDGAAIGTIKLVKMERHNEGGNGTPEGTTQRVDYYASSSGSTAVFKIGDFNFEQLNKKPAMFEEKSPATPSAKASQAPQAKK